MQPVDPNQVPIDPTNINPNTPANQGVNTSVPNLIASGKQEAKFADIEANNMHLKGPGKELIARASKPGLESLGSQLVEPLLRGGKGAVQRFQGKIQSINLATGMMTIRGQHGQEFIVQVMSHTHIKMQGQLKT